MVTKPIVNKFTRLRKQVSCILSDITFLTECKKKGITPNFIKVSCAVNNTRTVKVIKKAKSEWLRLEIKYLYSKIDVLQLQLYNLHLQITSSLNAYEYEE